MNPNIEQKQNELGTQAQTIEMPSSMRMIELSKNYLISIEKKFGVFLRKIGLEVGNYDGKIAGNATGVEKMYQEKILPLQKKIQTEKHALQKQELMTQLTQAVLQARGMDMGNLEKIARENGKQKEFQKASSELLGNQEYIKLQQELQKEVSKLDGVYTTENITIDIDKQKLRQELSKENETAAINYKNQKISKEAYEKTIENNIEKARQAGIELEVTKDYGKFLELGMQSGLFPITMMVTPGIKRLVPMLPSVIGIGIWARAVSLTQSNQSSGEKAWEGTKLVGETALTIAPITGTFMSGKETFEAYERYKNGTGSMSEVVANGIGTGVSAIFDGVTIFLVATGIGAAPAVGLQAVRATAKEAVKGGFKKIIGVFSKEGSEKAVATITQGVAVKSPGMITTMGKFVTGKIELVRSAYKELGALEFTKRAGRQALEDTVMGLWDIVTFRGIRDSKVMAKLPESMKIFEKGKQASSGVRANIVEGLEKVGLAKQGSAERIRLRGTAAEFRFINEDAQKYARDDGGASKIEEINAKYNETKSSKNHQKVLSEVKNLVKDGTPEQLDAAMNALKSQDEHIGNSLNVLNKILGKIENINNGSQSRDAVVQEIEMLIKENKNLLSDSLGKYLEGVMEKIKAGESFSPESGNFIYFSTKIHGNGGIESRIKHENPKGYEEYKSIIAGGERESKNGYHNNYLKTISELNRIIEGNQLRGEKLNIFMQKYLEIIKESEHAGWGTPRLEHFLVGLNAKIESGEFKNSYEGLINIILKGERFKSLGPSFINNLDLSLIHSDTVRTLIIDSSMQMLHSSKYNDRDKIDLIKKLSYYDEYKTLLKRKFNPLPTDIGRELSPKEVTGNYKVLIDLIESTGSNRDLIPLFDFLKVKDLKQRNSVLKDISDNIRNNDQINPHIGETLKGKHALTREGLDLCIKDVSKLPDFKSNFDTIIYKITGEDMNQGLSDKGLKKLMGLLESYEVNALFCKTYPKYSKNITYNIIDDGKNMSIEYKMRFITELEKLGYDQSKCDILKQKLASNLVYATDDVAFITKIEGIENFFNDKAIIKQGVEEYALLTKKISESKKTELFKENLYKSEKTLEILLDTERSFSDIYIKDLKNNGDITHYTLIKLDKIILKGGIVNNKGEITRSLSTQELEKIKVLRNQVETALNHYELNLFNLSDYKSKSTNQEKIKYLFDKIDEMSGWKFSRGGDNARDINRTIVKQLNVIKSNFNVEPHIIDGFLFEILGQTNIGTFNVHEKIRLLETLEKVGIIHPSVEQKQEYIINIGATSDDLRKNIASIKKYSKDFEGLLASGNAQIKNIKNEILGEIKLHGKELSQEYINSNSNLKKGIHYVEIDGKYYSTIEKNSPGYKKMEDFIQSTLNERVPVEKEYLEGKNLREGIDYIELNNKIYITEIFPSRFFMTRLLDAKDLRQKEAYMELVHNKTDFGGKSFRQYFDEVTDIETKIIMSYHDEIKYDTDVIQLLKDNSKKHPQIVMYAISKRKDYDLIIGDEISKGGDIKLSEQIFNQSLTKDYIEKVEGKKLSDEEYQKIRYGIEKMFQIQKNPEFMKILTGIRGEENLTDEQGKIRKEYEELLIKHSDTFDYILKEMNSKHTSIMDLLNSVDGKDLAIAVKGFQDKFSDKTKNASYVARKNIQTIKDLITNTNFRTGVLSNIHANEETRKQQRDTFEAANEKIFSRKTAFNTLLVGKAIATISASEAQSAVLQNSERLKVSPEVANTKVDINNYNLPPEVKQKTLEIFGKEINLKTVLGILITFGIMTPTEAQAAAQEIGDRWTSSPEYKEYQRLGGEKSAAARAIKEKAITEITRQVLSVYIQSFDAKYQELMDRKVKELPIGLQVLLGNIDIKLKERIKPGYDSMTISKLNTHIFNFVDSIYKGKGLAEKNLNDIVTKFPELGGTKIIESLIELGKNSDRGVKWDELNEEQRKISEMIKKM